MRAALRAALTVATVCLCAGPLSWAQRGAAQNPPGAAAPDVGVLNSLAGRPVHDIQFRGVASKLETQRLLALMPQKVGQPLDQRKLRASVHALYASGRFQDVQVSAEPAPQNELSLVIIARQNQFVGAIGLSGAPKRGPTDRQLVNASKLRLGELLTDDRVKQAVAGIEKTLADNGFYRATVTPQLAPHPETQQVNIGFKVDAGERARVGEIKVTGSPGLTSEQISELTRLRPGAEVTAQSATRALQRLRKHFQKESRLEAQVSLVSRSYRDQSNTVDYTLNIVRGPVVAIHVEGAHLPQSVVKRSVPVYEEAAVDDDLLNEGRRNLRDYLQTQGYYDAQVGVVRKDQPAADRTDIVFDANRGERHKLVAVAVEGNQYFPSDLILGRLQIQSSGWLLEHGVFSQSLLTRDVEAIRDLYRSNGFLQVNAYAEVEDNYRGQNGHMRVIVHVVEGAQTLVKDLNIEGAATFAPVALQNLLSNIPGEPFSDANMVADQDAIVNFYFNRGFPDITMTYAAQPVSGELKRMSVTYTIHEGERVFVNQVLVSGLNYTRPSVVDRRVAMHPGDPLSQADMLRTQNRLYDLGIFNEVDVAVQNPEGEEAYKDVLLDLTEARRYTFDYGLGFEVQTGGSPGTISNPQGRTGASPRVSFDVSRLNLRGRNDTLFFQSHVGRLEQKGLIGYTIANWLDNEKLKLTFNILYDNTLDVFTFTSQRSEGSMQVQQSLSRSTTLLYRFTYRDVRVSNLVISEAAIPQLSLPVRIGMPSFTYIRDTRDDPVNSHKGNYFVFDTGVTSHVFASQANFVRFLAQHSEYFAFGNKGKFVLAHSAQLGIEQPWGSSSAIVPLAERFFSGGGNSLRGFAINEAGPRDPVTGYQLGGEGLFVNNLELRLPPLELPFVGKDLSPVIFHDMGNVFASTSDLFPSLIHWRERAVLAPVPGDPSAQSWNFNYLSQAVGTGIRYRTPIGPVRFDVSYDLNPPTFFVSDLKRHETLHRINFFFSIGQTF